MSIIQRLVLSPSKCKNLVLLSVMTMDTKYVQQITRAAKKAISMTLNLANASLLQLQSANNVPLDILMTLESCANVFLFLKK